MVGNSMRSDILPVLELGGRAVHIPYEYLWGHEVAEHDGDVPTLASIKELPGWLAATAEPGAAARLTAPRAARAWSARRRSR